MSYGVTKRMQTPVVRKLKPQEKLNKVAEVFSKSPFCIILLGFFENTSGQNRARSLLWDARLLSSDIGTGHTLRTHSAALIGGFKRTFRAHECRAEAPFRLPYAQNEKRGARKNRAPLAFSTSRSRCSAFTCRLRAMRKCRSLLRGGSFHFCPA